MGVHLTRRAALVFLLLALLSLPSEAAGASTSAPRRGGPSGPSGVARVSVLPVPPIAVALRLASTAPSGISSSLDVAYQATLVARCRSVDGAGRSCALPAGTLTWRLDGGNTSPGNLTMATRPVRRCRAAVTPAHQSADCVVRWPTYGDQFLTATYESAPGQALGGRLGASQRIEVDLRPPVDLAAGRRFYTYANAGPGAIEDCTLAAAADLVEATYGAIPSPRAIVASYWAAEDADNAGGDVGLSTAQLFAYWARVGIGGTRLTGLTVVPTTEVEAELAAGQVLYATAELPAGFPVGSDAPMAHAWVVVGFSPFGPMVLSWGEELQLSWAQFDAWTTGVWSIETTAPSPPG